MLKINLKKFFLYSAIVILIFLLDRISKFYILKKHSKQNLMPKKIEWIVNAIAEPIPKKIIF